MRFWIAIFALSLSIPTMADKLVRAQWDALVDGVRASTRGLLETCTNSGDFVQCAKASGIRCENISEKATQDYRCVTQTTIKFAVERSDIPAVSETLEVTFRAFYSGERWKIGPESIGRVVN